MSGRVPRVWVAMAAAVSAVGIACGEDKADLSVKQLSRVVDEQRPTLKACYDAALEEHPHRQEMRMEAVIQIAPSGKVRQVELSEGGLPGMEKCLKEAIAKWQFPAAEAETHTSLPLIFKPEIAKQGGAQAPEAQ